MTWRCTAHRDHCPHRVLVFIPAPPVPRDESDED